MISSLMLIPYDDMTTGAFCTATNYDCATCAMKNKHVTAETA